ncbi:MAG: hypothetical protein SWY16_23845, partial [Cyanobacteriota bacterium]|nr:hypothetical protein [Cyanobacteriota bacterium]
MLLHLLLLLLWCVLGLSLRLVDLASQPPWTDECATLVFSLGNSFRTVPLDRLIGIDTLLHPLQPRPEAGVTDVFEHLMGESTHPPLYFILAHGWMNAWMKLFSPELSSNSTPENGLVSLWAARSLPALLGTASIPAIFGCCYLTTRDRPIAHLAAALAAVSPFAVYLAREARHYTLVLLLIIASFCCLVEAARRIRDGKSFPLWLSLAWIATNTLGIAVHYFFALTLCSELLVLVGFSILRWRSGFPHQPAWKNIGLAVLGTSVGSLVWFPIWQDIRQSNLTGWVYDGSPGIIEPIGRSIAWLSSTLILLPSDTFVLPLAIVVISGLAAIGFLIWFIRQFDRELKIQTREPNTRFAILAFGGIVAASLFLMLGFTYGLGSDLTLAPRFSFIYFPAWIILVATCLGAWLRKGSAPIDLLKQNVPVAIVGLAGILGSLTVISNLGYLQNHRSDLMADLISRTSQAPVLIATTHKHHGDTGRMMGLAWEFHHHPKLAWTQPPQFLLAHKTEDSPDGTPAAISLQQAVAELPRP